MSDLEGVANWEPDVNATVSLLPYNGNSAVWKFLGMAPICRFNIISSGIVSTVSLAWDSSYFPNFGALAVAYMTGYEVSRQQRISAEMAKLKAEVSSLESEVKTLKTAVPKTKRLYMCLG
ncbi:MAG: hypothetical protein LBI20_00890, partial [Holosporales bacterium]|nr:hypothetical protein [Holosporales bacterium]